MYKCTQAVLRFIKINSYKTSPLPDDTKVGNAPLEIQVIPLQGLYRTEF